MIETIVKKDFFNIEDTLTCGQIFRFSKHDDGYAVFSCDKCCFLYERGDSVVIKTAPDDVEYFKKFFDAERDYQKIVYNAKNSGYDMLAISAECGKGIRILKQDETETLFSFIISQQNNIKRIKLIIERLCEALGEEKEFCGLKYRTFPTPKVMAEKSEEFYRSIGLGFRARYIKNLADSIVNGLNLKELNTLSTEQINKSLRGLLGVGEKVANCVTLFGYQRFDSFPVDTWIEKVYKEYFSGTLTDRKQITAWFISKFKNNSGIYQQYLFHYRRNVDKK